MSLGKKILIIVLGIVGVGALGVCGYLLYTKNASPDKIFRDVINTVYSDFEKMMTSEAVITTGNKYELTGDLKLNSNMEELKSITDYKLEFKAAIDTKSKQFEGNLGLSKNNKTEIEASAYLLNNNIYVGITDVTSKLLKIDNSLIDLSEVNTTNISKEDIIYIVKTIKDLYLDTVKKEQFEEKDDTIVLDGKDTKVKVITYKLNEESGPKIINDIIDGMLKNKDLLQKIADISATKVADIENTLKDLKDNTDSESSESEELIINLYLKGTKLVKLDAIEESVEFEITLLDNKTLITLNDDESKESFKVDIVKNNDNYKIDFNFKTDGNEITGKVDIDYKEIDNKNAEGSIKFSLSIKTDGQTTELGFDINYKLKTDFNFKSINESNSIPFEEMPDEEQQKLMDKLMDIDLLKDLLMPFDNNSDFDDDWDDWDFDF